ALRRDVAICVGEAETAARDVVVLVFVAIGQLAKHIEWQRDAEPRLHRPRAVLVLVAIELLLRGIARLRRRISQLIPDPELPGGVPEVEELARPDETVNAVQRAIAGIVGPGG